MNETTQSYSCSDLPNYGGIEISQRPFENTLNMTRDELEKHLAQKTKSNDHILREPKPSPDDQPQSAHLFNQRNQIY